jgi:hypothetical protein
MAQGFIELVIISLIQFFKKYPAFLEPEDDSPYLENSNLGCILR